MAAETGSIEDLREAINMVSQAFSDGDYGAALLLLKPLADAGVPEAIGMLGLAYQKGAGIEVDSEKAIELFEKVIEMGDAIAAHHLGRLYEKGMPGVEPNSELSQRYLSLAEEMGLDADEPG